jgi:hypothetical protein
VSGDGEATQILSLTDDGSGSLTVAGAGTKASQSLDAGATMPSAAVEFGAPAPVMMTHDIHLMGNDKGKQKRIMIGIAGIIVLGMVAMISLSDESSLDSLLSILGLASTEEHLPPMPKKNKKPAAQPSQPPVITTASSNSSQSLLTNGANSIWSRLGNQLIDQQEELGPPLTSDQEATFSAALAHEFTYQRYKAVLDLAALKAEGSESLLRDALDSPKLWTRMRALMALAELGDEITIEDIKKGLGDAHSELRARFFQRFERSPCTAGCYFIARASLPHLDAQGREAVIRVIALEDDRIRDKFMAAATFDPSKRVRTAAQKWVDAHSIADDVWTEVRALGMLHH